MGMSMGSLGRGGKDGFCCQCLPIQNAPWNLAIPAAGQERNNRGSKGSQVSQSSLAQLQVDAKCICTISDRHPSTQNDCSGQTQSSVACWPNIFILVGDFLGIPVKSSDSVCNTAGYDVERMLSRLAPSRWLKRLNTKQGQEDRINTEDSDIHSQRLHFP